MTNNDSRNIESELKKEIYNLFGGFRSVILPDDYTFILFLLLVQKHNLISVSLRINIKTFEDLLNVGQYAKETESIRRKLLLVYPIFKEVFLRLGDDRFDDAYHKINRILLISSELKFSSLFDYFLFQINHDRGSRTGAFMQPKEITELIDSQIKLPKHASVFNPFAGVASFALNLDDSNTYIGQEIDKRIWAVGLLRLMAYDKPNNFYLNLEDSIKNWPDEKQKFDLIISHPPFIDLRSPRYRNIEEILIEKGINSLSKKGKLVALLPVKFLYQGGRLENLRKRLVEEDLVDTIIQFPGGLLTHSGISLILLILDLDKKLPGNIRFILADKFLRKSSTERMPILDAKRLIETINNPIPDKEYIRFASNSDIKGNNFNFNVRKLFLDETKLISEIDSYEFREPSPEYFTLGKKKSLIALRELGEFPITRFTRDPVEGKLVRIRDLKIDELNPILDLSEIETKLIDFRGVFKIDSNCILFAGHGKNLKPTYFKYTGEPIYIRHEIYPFKVNENKVLPEFLIHEFYKPYVTTQLEAFQFGTTIPRISKGHLKEIKINLPDELSEQIAIVQTIDGISKKYEELIYERNQLAHGIALDKYNVFASAKHSTGTARTEIEAWSDLLLSFFKNRIGQIENMDKEFMKLTGGETGIIDSLRKINEDINFITNILEKGENELNITNFNKEMLSLVNLNHFISAYNNPCENFQLIKNLIDTEQLNEKGIEVNKDLLRVLIDNIVTNAGKHAFKDDLNTNVVVIELYEQNSNLVVEIKNNGIPFPSNYDKEKFITKFSTTNEESGTGLGGYDINRIAEYFESSDWQLILNEEIYPVIFRFEFPIKPTL